MVLTSLWEDNRLNIFISPVSDTFLALASKKGFSPFQGYCVTGIQQIWWGFDESCSQSSLQVPSKIGFFCKSYNHINQKSIEQLGKQLLVKTWAKVSIPPWTQKGDFECQGRTISNLFKTFNRSNFINTLSLSHHTCKKRVMLRRRLFWPK